MNEEISYVHTEEYNNIFTSESIERAKRYAEIFQHGCHFMNDEQVLEVINLIAEKVKETFTITGEQMDKIFIEIMGEPDTNE